MKLRLPPPLASKQAQYRFYPQPGNWSMRLISFLLNHTACYGAVHGNKVLNLTPILGAEAPDLKTLIAKKMLDRAAEALRQHTPDLIFEDLSLLPVIPNP
jgi:hypothetical protein